MKANTNDKMMDDFAESVESLTLEEVEGETWEENEARWQTASSAHIARRDDLMHALEAEQFAQEVARQSRLCAQTGFALIVLPPLPAGAEFKGMVVIRQGKPTLGGK